VRLKSRGLGRKELVMDFREYDVIREGDEVIVVGTIRDPVNWDFSIRVCEDDIVGMAKLVLCRSMFGLILRSIFKPRKKHHWSQDRAEHLAEGRKRFATAKEKAAVRLLAGADEKSPSRVRKEQAVRRSAAEGT
jgi:hypothetical protein